MRIGLFLSLLISGTAFSQSKSDLKVQVASYQQRLDSMNLVLEKTQHINDSLSSEIQHDDHSHSGQAELIQSKRLLTS